VAAGLAETEEHGEDCGVVFHDCAGLFGAGEGSFCAGEDVCVDLASDWWWGEGVLHVLRRTFPDTLY
jgi:hypothetical protein